MTAAFFCYVSCVNCTKKHLHRKIILFDRE